MLTGVTLDAAVYRLPVTQQGKGRGRTFVRPYLLLLLPGKRLSHDGRGTGRYGPCSALAIGEDTYRALRRRGVPLIAHARAARMLKGAT